MKTMPLEVGPNQPKAALEFWKGKAQLSPAEFAGLTHAARARAFSVAGIAKMDQIGEIHAALQSALEKGETLQQFKKRLRPLLEQKGWTGKKAWRVENIYRTNMQSAYMAGRYQALSKTAKRRPYWRYLAVADSRTRPTHRALNGKVFPHDHEFWNTWFPPNGFMCRCTVQSLSAAQVEDRGLEVEDRIPGLVEPTDPATGNPLPAVPLVPDPGWGGNVGRDWLSGLAPRPLDGKIKDLATAAICKNGRDLFSQGAACKPSLASLDKRHILPVKPGDILPKGLKPEQYVEAFLKEFGLKGLNDSTVHTLPGGIPVPISKELFIDKKTGGWKVEKSGRERYVKLLAQTILNPYEVWMVPAEVSGRRLSVLRCLRLVRGADGKLGGFGVWNFTTRWWKGAGILMRNIEPGHHAGMEGWFVDYVEAQRSGIQLYCEK